jgi:isoamylase
VGEPIKDDTFLILLNSHHETVPFKLPPARPGARWCRCFDTRWSHEFACKPLKPGIEYGLVARSLAILKESLPSK